MNAPYCYVVRKLPLLFLHVVKFAASYNIKKLLWLKSTTLISIYFHLERMSNFKIL